MNDEVLKPRSVTMPDGRDIKSIEYKIDILRMNKSEKRNLLSSRLCKI